MLLGVFRDGVTGRQRKKEMVQAQQIGSIKVEAKLFFGEECYSGCYETNNKKNGRRVDRQRMRQTVLGIALKAA